jgi:hypothetical protein
MTPQKLRPTLRDCLAASATIARHLSGLAGQCARVAHVETTAAAGRSLARTADSLARVREALGARFCYAKPPAPAKE